MMKKYGSFAAGMVAMHMNSQSGQIFGISSVSAVLSEENLQEVLSLLTNE